MRASAWLSTSAASTRFLQECIGTRAAADQRERPHQVGTLFGERGGEIAAAGVPSHGNAAKSEAVEQVCNPACLHGHVV